MKIWSNVIKPWFWVELCKASRVVDVQRRVRVEGCETWGGRVDDNVEGGALKMLKFNEKILRCEKSEMFLSRSFDDAKMFGKIATWESSEEPSRKFWDFGDRWTSKMSWKVHQKAPKCANLDRKSSKDPSSSPKSLLKAHQINLWQSARLLTVLQVSSNKSIYHSSLLG